MLRSAPISVVIPAYNAEAFIGDTIRSVHAQTLPVSEIIVVDDGSYDRTAVIAQDLGATVIQQPNAGLPAARNTGIRAAGNPWIALLDADDLWEPKKIEHQWSAIQLCPGAGMVSCDTSSFEADRVICASFMAEPPTRYELADKTRLSADVSCFPRTTENFFAARIPLYPSAAVIRSDLLLGVGLFDEELRSKEDTECFLRVLARGQLVMVEKPLMRYRLHGSNMSKDKLTMYSASVAVAQRIISNPEKYAEGAARFYREMLPKLSVRAGRVLLERGRMRDARAMFALGLGGNIKLRVLMLWLSSWLSPHAVKSLRAAKSRLRSSRHGISPMFLFSLWNVCCAALG